jgi:hypothetical protein
MEGWYKESLPESRLARLAPIAGENHERGKT